MISGSWECLEAPTPKPDDFFKKGDIITFDIGVYLLYHPDNSKEKGTFTMTSNGSMFKLTTNEGEVYEFKVISNDGVFLYIQQSMNSVFTFRAI